MQKILLLLHALCLWCLCSAGEPETTAWPNGVSYWREAGGHSGGLHATNA